MLYKNIILLVLFMGCLPTQNTPVNTRVSSDTTYRGRAKFDGAFPAVNLKMAEAHELKGNYYYGQSNEGESVYHRVSIINPLGETTTLLWYIDGTEILGSDSKTFTISPDLFGDVTTLTGSHYVTVKLFDSSLNVLDSKKWIIEFNNRTDEFTQVDIGGESPASSITYAYSKAVTKEVTFSAVITDPANEGYYYKWYFDDEVINDPGSNADGSASFTIITGRYSNGIHTLTLRVRNSLYEAYFKEVSWGVTLTD